MPTEAPIGPREPSPESSEGLSRFFVKGSFENAGFPNETFDFDGEYTLDSLTNRVLGNLYDEFGGSNIIGEKLSDSFCFTKIYSRGNPASSPITYDLKKTISGVWIGTYSYINVAPIFKEKIRELSGKVEMNERNFQGALASRKNFDFVHIENLIDLSRLRGNHQELVRQYSK